MFCWNSNAFANSWLESEVECVRSIGVNLGGERRRDLGICFDREAAELNDSLMLKVYLYKGCSTCREAVKWLRHAQISFMEIPIRETPPSIEELRFALAAQKGQLRKLLNTSGQDYRALGLKDQLPTLSEAAVLKLLSENGNLIKRPFVVDSRRNRYLVGFQAAEWEKNFGAE